MPRKQTLEEFVSKAVQVHGSRYTYEKARYKNNWTPVTVTCAEHGDFKIAPSNHLQGRGCPTCGRLSQIKAATKPYSQFLEAARAVHGRRYRYRRESYTNSRSKMQIVCPKHGAFKQAPDSHLSGQGCPHCANEEKASRQRFTQKQFNACLEEKYGDKIRAKYPGMYQKTSAHCQKHGIFKTTPHTLLYNRYGCPACATEAAKSRKGYTTEEFVKKLRGVFGRKYILNQVKYRGSRENIILVCRKHGSFQKSAEKALRGQGCPQCAKEDSEEKRLKNLRAKVIAGLDSRRKEFFAKARERHGDFFDYSRVKYRTMRTPVTIGCPKHGWFQQPPMMHVRAGCRKCADEELKGRYTAAYFKRFPAEKRRPATLYYIRITTSKEKFYKVGITVTDVDRRFANLRGLGATIETMKTQHLSLYQAFQIERKLLFGHVEQHPYRPVIKEGPRGSVVGATECFSKPLPKLLLGYFE